MKGLFLCLIVVVAVTAVRSQGRPTRTKKGKRPSRRNDNPDFGLPSGADIPDGRRKNRPTVAYTGTAAALPAAKQAKAQIGRPAASGRRWNDNPDIGLPSGADYPDNRRRGYASAHSAPAPSQKLAPKPAPMPATKPTGITRTKSGLRPKASGRNDNPDWSLPSGRDYPDSRYNYGAPAEAPVQVPVPAPASAPATTRRNDNPDWGLPSGRDFPDSGRYFSQASAPAPSSIPSPAPAPATTRRNDNPDWGLPSGRDFPDSGRYVAPAPAPAPASAPVPTQVPIGRNDNPDWGLPSGKDFPDSGRYVAPAPAPAPILAPAPAPSPPVFECDYYCKFDAYKPVCTIYGNEYDNDCYRLCRNEPSDCDNACPCDAPAPDPVPAPVVSGNPWTGPCNYCNDEEFSQVCVDNEENLPNECFARCEGKTITCTSTCPCY